MNPGADRTWATCLPHDVAMAATVWATSGSVCTPVTTSTSLMTGTGLKKCIPTTRLGCGVPAAISVTDSEDVFVARMHVSPKWCAAAESTECLTSTDSRTASTTKAPTTAGD